MKVAVLGGGIAGLAAALRCQAAGFDVRVFEKSARLGGCVGTTTSGPYVFENGPNSVQGKSKQFRELLDSLGMMNDSVPGPDAAGLIGSPVGIGQAAIERYQTVVARLAVPYAVDSQKRATKSQYPATGLRGGSGLISSAREYAKFDLGLKKGGHPLSFEILSHAWNPVGGRPHGLGWFVQNYNGEKVVWSFGQGDNASSSLVIIVNGWVERSRRPRAKSKPMSRSRSAQKLRCRT